MEQGYILRIRRGLYYSIPKGMDPTHCAVDVFLVTSKMAEDAVIAYGSALDLHGKLHSIQNRVIYLTKKRVMASFDFRVNIDSFFRSKELDNSLMRYFFQ